MFKSDIPRKIPIGRFSFPDAVGSWAIEKDCVDIYGTFYMYFDRLHAENGELTFEGDSYDQLGPALVSGRLTKEKTYFVKTYIGGSKMTSCDAIKDRIIFEGKETGGCYEGTYRKEIEKANPENRFVLKISENLLRKLETGKN